MKAWGQPTKGRSSTSKLDSLLAEETAQRTRELLESRGWCLWKCSTLGGEVIAVMLNENAEGVPEGYPVYTEAELEELCRNDK